MPKAKRIEVSTDTPVKREVVLQRGLRREDAARYVEVSTAKFDECVKDGRMPKPFGIEGCVIWDLPAPGRCAGQGGLSASAGPTSRQYTPRRERS